MERTSQWIRKARRIFVYNSDLELERFVTGLDPICSDEERVHGKLLQFTMMVPRQNLQALRDYVRKFDGFLSQYQSIPKSELSPGVEEAVHLARQIVIDEATFSPSACFQDLLAKLEIWRIMERHGAKACCQGEDAITILQSARADLDGRIAGSSFKLGGRPEKMGPN